MRKRHFNIIFSFFDSIKLNQQKINVLFVYHHTEQRTTRTTNTTRHDYNHNGGRDNVQAGTASDSNNDHQTKIRYHRQTIRRKEH